MLFLVLVNGFTSLEIEDKQKKKVGIFRVNLKKT